MHIKTFLEKNKTTLTLMLAGAIASSAVLSSLYFVVPQPQVEAGKVWFKNGINVTHPKPPQVREYEPNERIQFTARFSWIYCSNKGPGKVVGRISRPVEKGTRHTGMGGFSGGVMGGRYIPDQHVTFNSIYSEHFRAPEKPGTYWFEYQIGVQSPEGDKYHKGKVVFRVKDKDRCVNLPGIQKNVPRGYYQTVNRNRKPVCFESNTRNIICSASKNPIEPNESVTFTARTSDGKIADFSWYNGATAAGTVAQSQTGVTESNYTRSYPNSGMYLVTALVETDTSTDRCVVGVTVRGENEDEVFIDDTFSLDDYSEDEIFITDDGEFFILDPTGPAGTIDFGLDGGITNDVCRGEWNAQYVLRCELYKNGDFFKEIEPVGEDDLTPGTYQIKCLQSKDGAEIVSEAVTCRQNPNIREI